VVMNMFIILIMVMISWYNFKYVQCNIHRVHLNKYVLKFLIPISNSHPLLMLI
jgi:hypothetical protein